MNLIPWRQKREQGDGAESTETALSRFRGEVDSLFERFLRDPWWEEPSELLPARLGWGPRLDLAESDDEVTVKLELPGVDPKEVEINVTGNVLSVRGEKKQEHEEKEKNYRRVERRYGAFHRSIQLPGTVDPDKVDAQYKNGLLTITLGKREDLRPKRIAVRHA